MCLLLLLRHCRLCCLLLWRQRLLGCHGGARTGQWGCGLLCWHATGPPTALLPIRIHHLRVISCLSTCLLDGKMQGTVTHL